MTDRLPPLTALRAFEAAARRLSFSAAAEELGVTPAALSFQVKSLEGHLGAPLFVRHGRSVSLTAAGQALLPGLSEGFASLTQAWKQAHRATRGNVLTVTTGPAFMAKWMAPRIYEFTRAHPDIELRFSASLRLLDFERDGIDVAIRFGQGSDAGLFSEALGGEWVTPAMAPAMAARFATPESLLGAPLIFDDSVEFLRPRCDWNAWFRAAGVEAGAVSGAHFSNADHAIDAALSGAGVVLGRASLMARDVAEGRLVAPFETGLGLQAAFRFICPEGHETRPAIAAFRNWVSREAETVNPLRQGRRIIDLREV